MGARLNNHDTVGAGVATDLVGDIVTGMVDSVATGTIGGNAPRERVARCGAVMSWIENKRSEIVRSLVMAEIKKLRLCFKNLIFLRNTCLYVRKICELKMKSQK